MKFLHTAFAVVAALFAFVAFGEPEQELSPLTPFLTECYFQDPVSVCRYQSNAAPAMLKVVYTGRLNQVGFSQVSVWVKLNGRSGVFRMEQLSGGLEVLKLSNGAIQCTVCRDDSPTCPVRNLLSKWMCTESPRETKDLFRNAVDEEDELIPWDLELAFVSGTDWDSLNGQNYRFRLE